MLVKAWNTIRDAIEMRRAIDTGDAEAVKAYKDLLRYENEKYAENGNLIVTDKNKAENLLTTIGVQPSKVSSILGSAKSILSQKSKVVNTPEQNSSEKVYQSRKMNTDGMTAEQIEAEKLKRAQERARKAVIASSS